MEEDIDQVGAPECRGDFHRACQHVLMLARREAAGETATWSCDARRRATTVIASTPTSKARAIDTKPVVD